MSITKVIRHWDWERDTALAEFVEVCLATQPEWHDFAGTGAWICPYCLAAVMQIGPGRRNLQLAIERHLLSSCGPFIARRRRGLDQTY